jgi:hypothetical protein
VQGARTWQFHHENALMYFPRLQAHDRLRGRFELFAPSGAVAGMLARSDESCPLWSAAEAELAILRPGYRPACLVGDVERTRLINAGVNVLQAVRAAARHKLSARTLAGGSSGSSDWKYLAARRLALFIITSIERGTHWVVFETSGPELWRRVQRQVEAFLGSLDAQGAFLGREDDDAYFVVCDDRINSQSDIRTGVVHILCGFAAMRAGEFHAYVISHDAAGSRVRPVSVNRLETGGRRLAEEMEGESAATPVRRVDIAR